jgi:hypothetical protein
LRQSAVVLGTPGFVPPAGDARPWICGLRARFGGVGPGIAGFGLHGDDDQIGIAQVVSQDGDFFQSQFSLGAGKNVGGRGGQPAAPEAGGGLSDKSQEARREGG